MLPSQLRLDLIEAPGHRAPRAGEPPANDPPPDDTSMVRSLDSLPDGTAGTLVRLGGERTFRRRLMELGLLPGTAVRVVRRVDVGGVLELEVRNCHLTLRSGEARELFVAPI